MLKRNDRENKLAIRRKIIPVVLALCLVFVVPVVLANSNNNSNNGNNSGPSTNANWHAWQEHTSHQPTPGTGCFEAKYPNGWQRTKCVTPTSLHPAPPTASANSATIGNGNDYVSRAPSGTLIGSADGILVVSTTGETDSKAGANAYSLQVNTNEFSTTFNGNPTKGWEQFVFQNQNSAGGPIVAVWFILIGYSTQYLNGGSCSQLPAPKGASGAWTGDNAGNCYFHNPTSTNFEPVTNISQLSLFAYANLNGNDEVHLCSDGDGCYANSQPSFLNLDQNWSDAEFNIFGIGNGSQAQFNPGTSITVQNHLHDRNDYPIIPVSPCPKGGYTGETNNLNLWSCSVIIDNGPNFINFSTFSNFTEDNIHTRTYTFEAGLGSCFSPGVRGKDCHVDNLIMVTVDGIIHLSPYTVAWTDGTTHTVSVPPSEELESGRVQYIFEAWSGMNTSTLRTITAGGDTAGTYFAWYNKQYYLTVNTNPSDLIQIGGSGWYNATIPNITVTTGTAPSSVGSYTFQTWEVDDRAVPGNPISIPMDTPHTATAVYINTPSGSNVTVNLGTGNSVNFAGVTTDGDTAMNISTFNPGSNPPGFRFLGTYYDITTTASYTPPVTVCLSYDPTGMTLAEQNALQIFHWDSTASIWGDITTSVDTTNHKICGQANSLSPFGIAEKLGSISGMKFNDINGNGLLDTGESGLANWTITLTNQSGVIATALTNESGYYSFTNLTDDNYTVGEVMQPGWIQTPASKTDQVQISGGNDVTGDNFGNFKLGEIHGMKWEDLNANHIKDENENGLTGWNITINGTDTITNTPVSLTTITDANGNYSFTNITAGTYLISESLKDGWIQTTPLNSTYTVTITSGSNIVGQDFGNFHKGDITGGGWISITEDPKATFGINGKYLTNSNMAQGNVEYQEHKTKLNIKSIQMNAVATTLDKKKGVITGLATVNGAGSYPFEIYIEDNGEPGKADVFKISLPTYPYSNGAVLGGGNIQIHS